MVTPPLPISQRGRDRDHREASGEQRFYRGAVGGSVPRRVLNCLAMSVVRESRACSNFAIEEGHSQVGGRVALLVGVLITLFVISWQWSVNADTKGDKRKAGGRPGTRREPRRQHRKPRVRRRRARLVTSALGVTGLLVVMGLALTAHVERTASAASARGGGSWKTQAPELKYEGGLQSGDVPAEACGSVVGNGHCRPSNRSSAQEGDHGVSSRPRRSLDAKYAGGVWSRAPCSWTNFGKRCQATVVGVRSGGDGASHGTVLATGRPL